MFAQLFTPTQYFFNVYAIPMFAAAAATFLFGAAVLIHERGSRIGRLFFYMTFMGGVWLFSFSWMYSAVAEEVALVWAKAGYLAVTFLPSLIYDFSIVSLHLEYQRRVWRRISWSFSALFALAVLLSDLLVGGVYAYWWGYYPKVAWLSIPFLLFFFGIMFLSLWEYDGQFRNAVPSVHRERTKSFLKAFGVGYFASFDFLANYGVPLYPFGYIPIFIFFLIMAKTIRRYRLIDMSPGLAAGQTVSPTADLLIVCDAEGTIQRVNRTTCATLGYSERELIGKPVGSLVWRSSGLEERIQAVIRGISLGDEKILFCGREGGTVELRVSFSPLGDREFLPTGVVIIGRDLSEGDAIETPVRQ
ncbi:MAG: PAS domain S-box protein [Candidatus Manganitrophus sp. SB1]|nr:PAS domain S-box protein [Candidatus Manganitrophus morganii]